MRNTAVHPSNGDKRKEDTCGPRARRARAHTTAAFCTFEKETAVSNARPVDSGGHGRPGSPQRGRGIGDSLRLQHTPPPPGRSWNPRGPTGRARMKDPVCGKGTGRLPSPSRLGSPRKHGSTLTRTRNWTPQPGAAGVCTRTAAIREGGGTAAQETKHIARKLKSYRAQHGAPRSATPQPRKRGLARAPQSRL